MSPAQNLAPIDIERIVYLHIPKCGGTTLHEQLIAWYGDESVHPERLNDLYRFSTAGMTPYRVFSGHYDYYSTGLIPGRRRLISFLRDPIDRLISLYNFHRAHQPDYVKKHNLGLARWAIELKIDDYFANETVRSSVAIDNSISRNFSDVPQIGCLWYGKPDLRRSDHTLMREQALKNLKKFEFIGFMDEYEIAMNRLAHLLGKPSVGRVEAKQTLGGLMKDNPNMRQIEKLEPSAETLRQMEELVVHDRAVYDSALAHFGSTFWSCREVDENFQ